MLIQRRNSNNQTWNTKKGAVQKGDVNKIISTIHLEYDIETCKKFINNVPILWQSAIYLVQDLQSVSKTVY